MPFCSAVASSGRSRAAAHLSGFTFFRYCWFSSVFAPDGTTFAQPYQGDLCSNGVMSVRFTEHEWPRGTKRDRGLNISFGRDLWLQPGESVSAGERGRQARR